MHRSGRKLSC